MSLSDHAKPPPPLKPHQSNKGKPEVIGWYKLFCVFMAIVYLLLIPLGVFLLSESSDDQEVLVNGIILVMLGPPFSIAFGLGMFLDNKPWHWIYGLVLIALSLSSCCCFPISIPLILYWLKPETKAYFERVSNPALP